MTFNWLALPEPLLLLPGLYNYILEHFDFEEKSMYLRSLTDNEKSLVFY